MYVKCENADHYYDDSWQSSECDGSGVGGGAAHRPVGMSPLTEHVAYTKQARGAFNLGGRSAARDRTANGR